VSPVELETLLARHSGILGAAVVGVPDDLLGEVVVACVVARDGADVTENDVRTYVREHLSSFKVPRRVLFFTADELPVTSSDKVQHAELRALALERIAVTATEAETA
jgi:acyl-coenzyme A synthetase/AMP-(fatty) acid ligase